MILFTDTESTGLFYSDVPLHDPRQPHIVSWGALLTDDDGLDMKQSFYTLIKPNGWKIPEQATQHHGITTEECETFGLDIKIPILWFSQMCYMASEIVIYNSGFDDNLIECEYLRLNKEHYISPAKVKCCMRPCTELLRLPNPRGFSGFKWPKLEEAYHFFFNKEMPKAHNAMADTLHTRDIYLELRRRNHV